MNKSRKKKSKEKNRSLSEDRARPRFNLKGKTFLVVGSKSNLHFYNHYTGENFHRYDRVHRKPITCVHQFGKRYLLTSGNKSIKIHSLYPFPQEMKLIQNAHDDDIWCFCSFAPNFFLTGSKDSTVKLWKFDSNECMHVFSTHSKPINSLARTGTGHFASASQDNTIQYCDLRAETVIASLGEHENNVKSLSFDPIRSVLLSGSWDGTVRLWDVRQKFRSVSIFKHEEFSLVNVVRYFPKYYFLSGDTLGWTRAWDLRQTSGPVRASQSHKHSSVETIVAAKERYATCSGNRQIRVHDFRTGDLMVFLEDPNELYTMCYCNCISDGVSGGRVMGKRAQKLLQKKEIFDEISKIRFQWTPKEDKVAKLSRMVKSLRTSFKKSKELIKRYKKALRVLKDENIRLEKLLLSASKDIRGITSEEQKSRSLVLNLEENFARSEDRLLLKDRIIEQKDSQIEELKDQLIEMKKSNQILKSKLIKNEKEEDKRRRRRRSIPRPIMKIEIDDEDDDQFELNNSNINKIYQEEEEEEEDDLLNGSLLLTEDNKDLDQMENEIGEIMDSVHRWKDKGEEGHEYYDSSDEEKGGEIVAMDIRKKIEERNMRVMQILKDRKVSME